MAFDTRLLGGLSVLTAVVEAGSFVDAGTALGLTQSGISRAVQRLEHQLNVRLFNRSSKAVTLTDEGRSFYQTIVPLLAQLEEATDKTSRSAKSVRGRLRVNVDGYFSWLALAPQIGAFLEAHPELSVEICVRDELGDLVADGFDVAVRFGEPEPSTLVARKLRDLRVITCASPQYLARHAPLTHPRQLEKDRHECLLFRDPATRRPFAWEFRRGKQVVNVAVSGRLMVNDAMTYLAACTSGLGVAQVFDWGLGDLLKTNQLVKVLPAWSDEHWPLYAFYLSRHHPPAKVGTFMNFLVSLVGREASSRSVARLSARRG